MKLTGIVWILIFAGLPYCANTQSLTDTTIIGSWEVEEVDIRFDINSEEQGEMLQLLKEAFEQAVFVFEADKRFKFIFALEEMKVDNGHWKFDKKSEVFLIKNDDNPLSDAYDYMVIKAVFEKGEVFFLPDETFLVLRVRKR